MDELLKNRIESEIKKDESRDVSLETAQNLLKTKSIDKDFARMKAEAAATQFKFDPVSGAQGLRPYQEQTIAKLKEFLKAKLPTVAVQLPTGAGKTYVVHAFLHEELLRKNKNVLVVAPSWEIANQHAMTMCRCFEDGASRVRRLGGRGHLISVFEEFEEGSRGKVIITTAALFFARQSKLNLNVGLVVIDEGHHGWKKLRLNSVQKFARERGVTTVLLTATPPRNMEQLPFAAQLKYLDLVPEYLVKCRVVRLETGEEFDPVFKNGILVQASRVEISSREERFIKIVNDSVPHMKGQTIYFAGSVREAMGVLREYEKKGITAVVVHSKWVSKADKINALAIERFRKGEAQVLVNVQMLAMGFDVPDVETIIVARPVESDTLFTQMVGRGARMREGKENFTLIDVHDTIFKPEVAKIFEHKDIFYSETAHAPAQDLKEKIGPVILRRKPKLPLAPVHPAFPRYGFGSRGDLVVDYFLKAS
jgi:superfamily II DNA or RNA helicase